MKNENYSANRLICKNKKNAVILIKEKNFILYFWIIHLRVHHLLGPEKGCGHVAMFGKSIGQNAK